MSAANQEKGMARNPGGMAEREREALLCIATPRPEVVGGPFPPASRRPARQTS